MIVISVYFTFLKERENRGYVMLLRKWVGLTDILTFYCHGVL